MLFSELNRINLNVLIQEPEYEMVPDISSCYVHNADNWTIWCERKYSDSDINGWKVKSLIQPNAENETLKNVEDLYIRTALNDVYSNIKLVSEPGSDLVKIYAGEFDEDGQIDFDKFVKSEEPIYIRHECRDLKHIPQRQSWWTFSNGAFQWIGGPKSIFECRFSYGPFSGPDPHHCDNNHKDLDDYIRLYKIPNLIVIFDEMHIFRGIISLPCHDEEIKRITEEFIEQFFTFVNSTGKSLTFKNFDELLKEYSLHNLYIPTIRFVHSSKPKMLQEPVNAIFKIETKFELDSDQVQRLYNYYYIYPFMNGLKSFLENSVWSSYSIDKSFHISAHPPIHDVPEIMSEHLEDENTMHDVMTHVNALQDFTTSMYDATTSFVAMHTIVALLSESYLQKKPKKCNDTLVALMTPTDLFKQAKNINKVLELNPKSIVIVLPEQLCNKDVLQYLVNVRYV